MQGEVDSNGEPIDAAFYSSFWGLQAIFEQPYSAIEPSKWTVTITDIKRVLTEFGKQARPFCPQRANVASFLTDRIIYHPVSDGL